MILLRVTKIVDFYEEGRMQWQKAYLMFFHERTWIWSVKQAIVCILIFFPEYWQFGRIAMLFLF